MKNISIWLGSVLALMCITGVQAADMDKANVIRVYTDVVTPAEQTAYETGVKSYNQCLSQHGFGFKWTAWGHETGNTYSYSYTSDPVTWADFDTMQTTGKACDSIWETAVNPHLMSETSVFLEVSPDLSVMPKGMNLTSGLVEVAYIKLKIGYDQYETFKKNIKMMNAAVAKSNWQYPFMTATITEGDRDAADFVFITPAKNWSEFGKYFDASFIKMLETAYGKKKTQALLKSTNDVIQDSWSHVDSYNADLTYTPAGK